jgi:hypothetical protein
MGADARIGADGCKKRTQEGARVAGVLGRVAAGTGGPTRNDLQVNCLCCKGLVENEVQDNQYDQRDAQKPAEKVRHDVISFRINV